MPRSAWTKPAVDRHRTVGEPEGRRGNQEAAGAPQEGMQNV